MVNIVPIIKALFSLLLNYSIFFPLDNITSLYQ